MNPEPLPQTHCFLSEFDVPGLRWLARSKHAGWLAALLCMIFAGMVTLLGHQVGANACGFELVTTFPAADGRTLTASRKFISGWLAMANHAPFYLLVAPVLLVVTHRFLLSCGEALSHLYASGRLVSGKLEWHDEMARKNRRFMFPLFGLLALFLVVCLWFQLSSVGRVMSGYPTKGNQWTEVGYVQSIALEGWCKEFNGIDNVAGKIAILENCKYLQDLQSSMVKELDGRNATIQPALGSVVTYAGSQPAAVKLADADDPAKAAMATSLTIEAKALRPAIDSWLGWRRYVEGREQRWFPLWFKTFVIAGQVLIAIFFTFAAWLVLKILFWLIQIYRMLPGPDDIGDPGKNAPPGSGAAEDPKMSFKPMLHDPAGRYGLSALFRPYNLLVLSATIGASYLALKLPSGIRSSDITNAHGVGSGATAFGHLILITVVMAAIVSGPLLMFPKKLHKWARTKRLDRLAHELLKADHRKHQVALLEEEETICKQTTWPAGDTGFKVTVGILLAVLLLPLSSALQFLPGDAIAAIRLPQALRESCEQFFAERYGLKAK